MTDIEINLEFLNEPESVEVFAATGPKGKKGDTGNGILSTELNDDYTLTITFTDGTSYTTEPIRGEKGDRGHTPEITTERNGNVTAILVDGVTAAIIEDGHTPVVTASKEGKVTTVSVDDDPIATINDGADGHSPVVSASKSGGVTTVSVDGTAIAEISDGEDGYSPTATVTKSGSVSTITITDENGTTTETVSDGHSPVVTTSKSGKVTTILSDGEPIGTVSDGADGVTPVRGTDYWTAADKAEVVSEAVSGIIDDTAGDGDTDKVWSADKVHDELAGKVDTDQYADTDSYGLVRAIGGLKRVSGTLPGCLYVVTASQDLVKAGSNQNFPVTPFVQHASTFYGLAKAAGDTTQSASDNAVGVYTDAAKSKIKVMLGTDENLATVEASTTSSKSYAVGELLVLNSILYRVTAVIATGETIAEGTNVTATKIDELIGGDRSRLEALEGLWEAGTGTSSIKSKSANTASGNDSVAEGINTYATNQAAHAEGYGSVASGQFAHSEGYQTQATGSVSHSEGYVTHAEGSYSHADGAYTHAKRAYQHVFGAYNVPDSTGANASAKGTYIEIVGNGTETNARSNARTLDWNGNEVLAGKLTVGAAPANDMDAATKKYVDDGLAGKVDDVQVGGTSVVANGVANVPIAADGQLGVVKPSGLGITVSAVGNIGIAKAPDAHIKNCNPNNNWSPIVPSNLHTAVFYGLANASGDATQAASDNAVGTYTDEAKESIKTMIGVAPWQPGTGTNAIKAKGADSATNNNSVAEGNHTRSTGSAAHAEGSYSVASGTASHAENSSSALGNYSHAEGNDNSASGRSTHVGGEYANDLNAETAAGERGTYAEIIGNGLSTSQRSNARTLDWSGNERLAGNVYVGCSADSSGGTKLVSETDYATDQVGGVVKVGADNGVGQVNGVLFVNRANSTYIKAGTNNYRPIVPNYQHEAAFYGLAKSAGDTTQSASNNAVGTYTDIAKSKIRTMLGVTNSADTATVIDGDTATDNIAIGQYVIWKGDLYKASAVIANGETLSSSNLEAVTDGGLNDVKTYVDTDYVKKTDYATSNKHGIVKVPNGYGLVITGTQSPSLVVDIAVDADVKAGTSSYKPLNPARQHSSTFYGLAKAAGDTTQSASNNAVGTYTDDAKTAIRTMLGAVGTADYATESTAGVVKTQGSTGIVMGTNANTGIIMIAPASSSSVKSGTALRLPIVPGTQHESVFYGLAKAAGDSTQASSENAVGTYTTEAKSAIKSMLDIPSIDDTAGDGDTGKVWSADKIVGELAGKVGTTDYATSSDGGVVKVTNGSFGLFMSADGYIQLSKASDVQVKAGTQQSRAVVPYSQHMSTFYGLAKAAGDTTQAASDNAVGTYTDDAKTAIRTMLGTVGTADYATASTAGIAIADGANQGIGISDAHKLVLKYASDANIKSGLVTTRALTPYNQQVAVFYGLAKAAGDATQAASENAVGTYTSDAKTAIRGMLDVVGTSDYATASTAGVVMVDGGTQGIAINESHKLAINTAAFPACKYGTIYTHPVTPGVQHASVFYGLAKAAGDTTQSQSDNAIGTYTDTAKAKIRQMLDTEANLATVETGTTASQSYAIGDLVVVGSVLYRVTAVIGTGETFTVGTNITATKVSDIVTTLEGLWEPGSGTDSVKQKHAISAIGNYAVAEGLNTYANGQGSHAEGGGTVTDGNYSHTEGYSTRTYGYYSHAEGYYTQASRRSHHVFGEFNVIDDTGDTVATRGTYIEIVGNGTSTSARSNARTLDWSGNEVLAGKLTVGAAPTNNMDVATKQYVDTGDVWVAGTGTNAVMTKGENTASGDYSVAEGYTTTASGKYAHTEGYGTIASNWRTHAEGMNSVASGLVSHTEGISTIAQRRSQHVSGEYNVADTTGANNDAKGAYLEIIGNGTSTTRSNARALDWSGNEYLNGNVYVNCSSSSTGGTRLATVDEIGSYEVPVSGTDPVITAQANTRYLCGEVYTISITPCSVGICDVVFTSGSSVAVLTLPNTVKMPAWFDASALETNTIYEINIVDGVYGAVMTWQTS